MVATQNLSKKTNIMVTGDFIRDYNIIKQPINPTGYRDRLSSTVMKDQAGGAWYLYKLIKLMHGSSSEVLIPEYPNVEESTKLKINQAYQVWRKYIEKKDGKEKSIWRIENFLGCEKSNGSIQNPDLLLHGSIIKTALSMLVIDDISLGFGDDIGLVNDLLRKIKNANNIILKTHSHQFNSYLWKCLDKTGLLKKTTVIITADTLREGGAYITRGFSWDKTIEETAKEFDSGHFSLVLSSLKI